MIDLTDHSYRLILARMLSRIPDSLDKREGSIIYDALAPAAFELARYYQLLDAAYANTFVATASGAALDLKAEELGLTRQSAVKAVRKGLFMDAQGQPYAVPLGSRFSTLDGVANLNFVVRERLEAGVYRLECESAGAAGNDYVGELMAIERTVDLAGATLTDIIVPGAEAEDDEALRRRVQSFVRSTARDGNAAQYYEWAAGFTGIGRAKVFPLWQGVNTVKVSILNSLFKAADPTLVADFQAYLDPSEAASFAGDGTAAAFTLSARPRYLDLVTLSGQPTAAYSYEPTSGVLTLDSVPADGAPLVVRWRGGLGNGQAPVGAVVTVTTASERPLAVAASVTLADGFTLTQASEECQALLTAFFDQLAYTAGRVNYIEVGALILSAAAVEAVSDLTVAGAAVDVTLGDEEIAALGALTLTEAS